MADKQKTIQRDVVLQGKGLHTGNDVMVTIKPAPENFGYKFQRVDISGSPIINALVENVVDTSRGTTIEENGVRVSTVEHILSALYGLEIDNALIEINNSEVPILDGSAIMFVNALLEAGVVEQNADRTYFVVNENIVFVDEKREVEIVVIPDSRLSINLVIDYDSGILLSQHANLKRLSEYKTEIAPCRTFVFLKELEYLLSNNLIKGGDLSNAIVISDRETTQEELDKLAVLLKKPKVEVRHQGILNDRPLTFPNEPARHKILDLIGDIALLGMPIKGRIIAKRSGHLANVEFTKKMKSFIKKEKKHTIPVYDSSKPPLYDINKIKSLLPHRYPFLLVDKILEMDKTSIVGLKNVTANEEFFNGHFPQEPVMPGVLQIEAMAQVGGILVLSEVPDPHNYTTLFLKIDNVRFKRKVVPGDTLIFRLELITPIRRGIANMRGQGFVGENLVIEGELMAQISKKA